MKEYRIYRKRTCIEYKDIDCKNEDEVKKHILDPSEEFKITDSDYITDSLISTDLKHEKGNDIFIERDTGEDA